MDSVENVSPVGVLNLLGVFSATNLQPGGGNPNKFGTPTSPGEDSSHGMTFFDKAWMSNDDATTERNKDLGPCTSA
jgi:hypothetical protein